ALAGILVEEIAAHVWVLNPGQRPSRRLARGAAADRRHSRQPRVGIVLPLDLVAFGAHRGEEPGAACRGKKPGKIQDLDSLQRERLVVQRRKAGVLDLTRACGHARAARRFTEHRLGVLAQEWRPAADLPARLVAEPFAGWVGERTPELRMLDLGKGFAYPPVLVERVLVRLAQRRP